MDEKLISVCINAYNAEHFILKTVNSVLSQTHRNLQVIIVDDCSTDNTYQLLKSIEDERVEVYRTPFNGHMSFACNEALKHARGDYIAHLDADDIWLPEKLEKQLDFLENNPEYGACFTHVEIIGATDEIESDRFDYLRNIFSYIPPSHAGMYRNFFDGSNRLCHSSAFIRSEMIRKVGEYDVSILHLQDYDYWMRLITYCPIYILPEKLTLYRSNGASSDNSIEKWNAHNTEFMRIIYKSAALCPDNLFLAAFSDRLKFCGEHTHDEVEIEKALILLEGTFIYKSNPVLGLYKFSELFGEEKFIKLARQKFGFTARDLYRAQSRRSYFNEAEHTALEASKSELEASKSKLEARQAETESALAESQEANLLLRQEAERLEQVIVNRDADIKFLHSEIKNYQNSLEEMRNSFYWRLTSPCRFITQKIKNIFRQ